MQPLTISELRGWVDRRVLQNYLRNVDAGSHPQSKKTAV
jgi:hypothetical protein